MNRESTTIITSKHRLFDLHLAELWRYRDLITLFVRRTFVSQYKQTILGPVWAIVQPLLTTVVFTLVFGNIAGLAADGVPSFVFYLSANILWTYFSTCLSQTANTFVVNRGVMGKVYFPRLVMPISTVISGMIMLAIQYIFLLLFICLYAFGGEIHPNFYILLTPVLVLQLAMLSLGCGIIISALTTKYRDLVMLVTFGLQLWMYATPVAYDMFKMEAFAPGGTWYTLYMLNPVTPIVNIFRYAYLGVGQVDWLYYGLSWAVTALLLFLGLILFNRVEKTFMDTI